MRVNHLTDRQNSQLFNICHPIRQYSAGHICGFKANEQIFLSVTNNLFAFAFRKDLGVGPYFLSALFGLLVPSIVRRSLVQI